MEVSAHQLNGSGPNRVLWYFVVIYVCWKYQDIGVEATTCDCGVDCVSNCTAGQYWLNGSCTDCYPGYYCPGGQNCSPGDSCVLPCPIGTYTANRRSQSEEDCLLCPPGSYCQTPGLSWPTGECNPGWFCTGGAKSAQPAAETEGRRCKPGEFCPRGSSEATPCTPGMYCDNYGLAEPTGNCIAGYYCLLGARYPDPYDGDTGTGDICPRGYYCPEGSSYTIACPPGTFSNNYGNREVADCQACPMGSYCGGFGNSEPSGPCNAGYYCPGGQNTSTPAEFICPRGHFCPLGSFAPVLCAPGSYQDQTGQWACKECPAGFYCPPAAGSLPSGPVPCPAGYYCGNGTHRPHPCPRGTTSNTTYLTAAEECSPCPPGRCCGTEGLAGPTAAEECSPCPPGCCCGTEGLVGPTGASGGSCVTVGNASEFSSASLIAVSSVAGVAILVAMATSLLYIGNRLELRKIQSAKPQPGMNGHYGSLREPHYEVIPDTVGSPQQLPVARIPPVEHTDIELQATGTDHQAKGVGGRNRRHPKDTRSAPRDTNGGQPNQRRGARVPAGSPRTRDPDYDAPMFENEGESDEEAE